MDTMRTDLCTVFTVTDTEFVFMSLERFAIFVSFKFNDCIKSRLKGLSVLTESALKVNSIIDFAKGG